MEKRFPIFAERFYKLRKDMSQAEFAKLTGLSRPTIGFYENGSRLPDALTLKQICKKCKVSSDWLLGFTEEQTTNIDLKRVCDYTGLSENVINIISEMNNQELEILSSFITSTEFEKLKEEIKMCRSNFDNYKCGGIVADYDKDRYCSNRWHISQLIEKILDKICGDINA